MEILGWIVAGLVILGFLVAGVLKLSYRLTGPVLKAPREIAASIEFVREIPTPDKSWPEYMLTLSYEADSNRFARRLVIGQVDFSRLLPSLPINQKLDGTATVPLLVDFYRGDRALLDPRWLAVNR